MSMVPAVAGGGVPLTAWNTKGMEPLFDRDGGSSPVFATWAFDTPTREQHKACQEFTKKGERCTMPRIPDEDGNPTGMCIGHWNGVVAYVKKLEPPPAVAVEPEGQ